MPMKLKAQLMDDVTVKRALTRLSYEIIEKKPRPRKRGAHRHQNARCAACGADCGEHGDAHRCKGSNLHTGYYILPRRPDKAARPADCEYADASGRPQRQGSHFWWTMCCLRAARCARRSTRCFVSGGRRAFGWSFWSTAVTASCPFALILWARISPPLYARSSPCIWKLWTARRTWKSTSRTRTNRKSTGNDPLLVQKSN